MSKGLRGAWWWIDRWRQSAAFIDFTLAQQGAYRNLLDELWLRGGVLPDDQRVLARASGDPLEWPDMRDKIMAKFYLTAEGWRHQTVDEVMAGSAAVARKRSEAGKRGAEAVERGEGGKFTGKTGKRPAKPPANEPANRTGKSPASVSVSVTGTETDNGNGISAAGASRPDWNREFAEDFREVYRCNTVPAQFFKQVKPLVERYGWPRVRAPLLGYMRETAVDLLSIPKVMAVRIESGAQGRASPGKAKARMDGMEALVTGRVPDGESEGVDAGHGGTRGDLADGGRGRAGQGTSGPALPAGVATGTDGPPVVPRRQ